MKKIYIKDISLNKVNGNIELYGWITQKKEYKSACFFKLEDSTGRIECCIDKQELDCKIKNEQSVCLKGVIKNDKMGKIIIDVKECYIIGDVKDLISPSARADFDFFSEKNASNTVKNKNLYIRNRKFASVLFARDLVIRAVREWFYINGYVDVTAPILTPVLLYDKRTGIEVNIKGQETYLTQCVGFYLESAVHSLEKVYNIGPSFRAEESVSRRHLMEYWHVKSELAFCEFEEYFDVVENMISFVFNYVKENSGEKLAEDIGTVFCDDGICIPFSRVEYKKAIELVNDAGIVLEYGKSLNDKAEKYLSDYFGGPVWVVHKPKIIEGFPYKRYVEDLTLTADLIGTNGKGEILGIAEKVTDIDELKNNLRDKNKDYEDYKWFCDLREYGTIPHCGMGMGLERLIRWIFNMNHVKDVIPFPRRINNKIFP